MAKDGSRRGGARPGAGRKKKNVQPPNVAEVINAFKDGEDEGIPQPDSMLCETKGVKYPVDGVSVYYSIFRYLKSCSAEKIVPKELVEMFAATYARWKQAEAEISKKGFLAPHPTTGAEYTSPMVQISAAYMKQAMNSWFSIYSIAKEAEPAEDEDDKMGKLLGGRFG